MPKISSIRAAVSIEHRPVMDRQTDGHRAVANTALVGRIGETMNDAGYPVVKNFVLVIMLEVQRINVECVHDVIVVLKPHKPHTLID